MPTLATVIDPRKSFRYTIAINGLVTALVRKVNIPDVEIAEDKHGFGGLPYDLKTAGKMKFGDITLEKVMPAGLPDLWAYNWLKTVINPETNLGGHAINYKRNVTIIHLSPEDVPIGWWRVMGAWPKKLAYSENDALKEADAVIEKVTLACDKYIREI